MATQEQLPHVDQSPGHQTHSIAVTTPTQPQKRRKVATACEPCRNRKSRCDGEQPICGPCQNRPESLQRCVYSKHSTKRLSESQAGQNPSVLADRDHTLEPAIVISPSHIIPENRGNGLPSSGEAGSAPIEQELNDASGHGLPTDSTRHSSAGRQTGDFLEQTAVPDLPRKNAKNNIDSTPKLGPSPVDAMGSTHYLNSRAVSPATEFYGGSSAAFFMHQVKDTIARKPSDRETMGLIARSRPSFYMSSVPSSSRTPFLPQESLELPMRDTADQLMAIYWIKSHTLYPFLSRTTFSSAYTDLWKPRSNTAHDSGNKLDLGLGSSGLSDSRSTIFHCALNAVFALSCQLADRELRDIDCQALSETFFLRSKKLLHIDILEHGSIAIVQTLLIVALYLQGTSFPSRCWNSLGLACRLAQGLGLHTEAPKTRRSPHEQEVRRRTWYGCIVMDVVTSMTLGRPMMTPSSSLVPVPSASEEEDIMLDTNDASSGLVILSPVSFYVETIKLYCILGEILSRIYRPWLGSRGTSSPTLPNHLGDSSGPEFEHLVSLDEELSSFEDGIVQWLHWTRGAELRASLPESSRRTVQRQSNVLYARYLHIRILLYRPTFLRFCHRLGLMSEAQRPEPNLSRDLFVIWGAPKNRNLRSALLSQSSVACIGVAIDIVHALSESFLSSSQGAWWYTTFYLCSAGMIFILAESCLPMHEYFDINEIRKAWEICCETLNLLALQNGSVGQALNGLLEMHQKLVPSDANSTRLPTSATLQNNQPHFAPKTFSGRVEEENNHETRHAQPILDSGQHPSQDAFNIDSIYSPQELGSSDLFGEAPLPQMWIDTTINDIGMLPLDEWDENWWRIQQ